VAPNLLIDGLIGVILCQRFADYQDKTGLTHTHPFNSPLAGTTRVSRYQKGKPIWILLKQETVSGSGIHWAICKSAPHSSQITTPVPHHSVCLQAACPSCHPTNSVKALKTRLNTKYKDRLHIQFQHLKLPTLKCRRLCGDMIEVFKITHNICNPDYHLNWNIITRIVALEVININFLITHYIWLTQNTIFCMHRWYLE